MYKKLLTFTLLSACTFMLSACGDDDESDVTKPTINVIAPADDAELVIGDANGVTFEMEVGDNEALASYKINIHSNFDGHTHSRASEANGATTDFTFNKTYTNIAGQRTTHVQHNDIVIPANATPGHYHLVVYLADQAGNETYAARDIVLIEN